MHGSSTDGLVSFAFPPHTGFINARTWLADVREHADPNLTCILVGNKVDLCSDPSQASESSNSNSNTTNNTGTGSSHPSTGQRSRQVPTEEAELWAKEEGILFVEASAKSGVNVETAFESATRDILDKIRRGVFDDDRVSLGSHLGIRACDLGVGSREFPRRYVHFCIVRVLGAETSWLYIIFSKNFPHLDACFYCLHIGTRRFDAHHS